MENIDIKTKILAAIAYVPFPPLFIIPLLVAKKDSFAEFHGKQGLAVFILWFVLWIVSLVPYVLLAAYLGFLVFVVAAVFAIVKVFMGQRWKIPLLGNFAEKLKF